MALSDFGTLSIVLALSEQFKFNYDIFNRHLAYGGAVTPYPLPSGTLMDHHMTFEAYECLWPFTLFEFASASDMSPLIFPTQRNFFTECCTGTFLTDVRYQHWEGYPIWHPDHNAVFTPAGVSEMGLSELVLQPGFLWPSQPGDTVSVAVLNFCQQLLLSSILLMWGLTKLFGPTYGKATHHLQAHWHPVSGEFCQRYSLADRHLIAYLYLVLHPAATLLGYGIYRNKYGIINSHRTTLFVPLPDGPLALNGALREAIQRFLTAIAECGYASSAQWQQQARAAIQLGQYFGIGYRTVPEKGQNPHWDVPHTFECAALAEQGFDLTIHHDPSSPLWRIFYDYAAEWWTPAQIQEIIAGVGPEWEDKRHHPRANAIQVFHQIAAWFWRANPTLIQTNYQHQRCTALFQQLHLE